MSKLVINCTNEDQSTKVYGNHFFFKSRQIKIMEDRFADFVEERRSHQGFMVLPKEFEDPEYRATEDGKKIEAEIIQKGIKHYLSHLKTIVTNNLESLRQDLRQKNIDTDPRFLMSEGEMNPLELLSEYQAKDMDEQQKRVDKAKELEKKLGLDPAKF